jgi:hypothetical protein
MAKPKRRTEEAQVEQSSSHAAVIVPSDGNDLPFVTRFIEIAAAGTLSIIDESGAQVDFPSFPAGHTFFVRATRIRATGTSVVAGSVIAYY